MEKKTATAITPSRAEDYAEWYQQVVRASDMAERYEGDTVGALAASITTNIQKSLERLKTSPLSQVTIEADENKLFFTDAGKLGILVVTTEPQVNIGLIRLEIRNALEKLQMAS